jgi:putative endopeptidase
MTSKWLMTAGVLALAATPLAAQTAGVAASAAPAAKTIYGDWGVDLSSRDLAVKPGDDFQKHATGSWLASHDIPADRPSISAGMEVFDRTQANLQKLLQGGTNSAYGILFQSFMDEARVEAAGLAPLRANLAEVHAIRDKRAFARFMGRTNGRFGSAVIGVGVGTDTADPTLNVLYVGQAGLGLPEREYYFAEQFKTQREAYRTYIERTMRTIGTADPAGAAATILAFETAIADKSWKVADRRDITRLNNPMSSAELARYAPGLDWAALFAGLQIPAQKRMIVGEKTAVRDIAAIYAQTPLATLKLWQQFHVTDQASPYLNQAMVDSQFDFSKTFSGVTAQRPRWKRAVGLVDGALGELVGQDYVRAYFPAEAKAKMVALVANLKLAMGDRIRANDWMSAPTKTAALEKLGRMDVMVGYPDKFRDYAALKIVAGDLYGNVERAGVFNTAYQMADLGKRVDRRKWAMNPQQVDAYNGGLENKIVFPAGILQAPMFDMNADEAVNYGAIGAVIGHEISHGFDDQGRKIDASGAVRDWWAEGDGARFEARAKVLGDQYAKFEAAPGAFVNPALTMGENIADFAGLAVSLDAYHRALDGTPAPVIDGLTGDQRFFLAFAQAWRGKAREAAVRQQVATDPHSPRRFRLLGPVSNMEQWYQAFGVKPGDAMYIAPEKRAKIW